MNRQALYLAPILMLFSAIPSLADTSVTKQPASLDSWFGSVYYQAGQHDDKLVVGGWADTYYTLLQFDISALPANATSATLFLYSISKGDGSKLAPIYVDMVTSPWNQNTGFMTRPNSTNVYSAPAPTPNTWYNLDITTQYNQWKSGAAPNYGIQLRPALNNNNFSWFRSSNYGGDPTLRPKLVVTYSSPGSGTPAQAVFQPLPQNGVGMWYSSSFNQAAVNDYRLQVGGWGDQYRSLIRFNLNCMPKVATSVFLSLYSYDRGDSSHTVTMNLYALASSWNQTTSRYTDPLYYYTAGVQNGLAAPSKNSWYSIDITSIYNNWQSGIYANLGILLQPTGTNNQFNAFYSSNYIGDPSRRPKLVVNFIQQPNQPFQICFPLKQDGFGAYTASISAIMDHSMSEGDCPDGLVTAYDGEQGAAAFGQSTWSFPASGASCPGQVLRGFLKRPNDPSGPLFSVNGQYVDMDPMSGRKYLFYDGHTGYDYPVPIGTPVYATADGTIFYDGGDYNQLRIVHDIGGYETYYLHLSGIYQSSGRVRKGDLVAFSGNIGLGSTRAAHLHVTIKKNGKRVDPYGWTGSYADPYSSLNPGVVNIRLWE